MHWYDMQFGVQLSSDIFHATVSREGIGWRYDVVWPGGKAKGYPFVSLEEAKQDAEKVIGRVLYNELDGFVKMSVGA